MRLCSARWRDWRPAEGLRYAVGLPMYDETPLALATPILTEAAQFQRRALGGDALGVRATNPESQLKATKSVRRDKSYMVAKIIPDAVRTASHRLLD